MIVRAFFTALLVFCACAGALGVFWTIVLGPVMGPYWDELPGWVGPAATGFAVLSGLGIYGVVLRRALPEASPGAVIVAGALPPLLAAAGGWAVLSNVHFGF